MVHARAKIGEHSERGRRAIDQAGVDAVGHGRHQYVGVLNQFDNFIGRHLMIVVVEAAVEQFGHPRLDLRQKLASDGDARAFDALELGHANNPMARRNATSSYHP